MSKFVLYREPSKFGIHVRWGIYYRDTLESHSRMWWSPTMSSFPFEPIEGKLFKSEVRSCPLELAILHGLSVTQVYYTGEAT